MITLRPATPDDFAYSRALKYEAVGSYIAANWGWDEPLQDKMFADQFDGITYYIIQNDGTDIGTVRLIENGDIIEVHNFCIHKDWRRQGLGVQVMNHIAAMGKIIELDVLKNNPAQNLYRRLGYVVFKEDENWLYLRFVP